MKHSLITILLFFTFQIKGQDTTISQKVKSSFYGRSMPVSLYTGAGYMTDKVSSNVEFGRSTGVLDIGVAIGQINQRVDSNKYCEIRCTMDASQYGKTSSEITIGVGKVFNSQTPIMLEISYTIFYQVYKKWGIGIVTGYYDFSGNTTDVSKTFYGVFIRYGLLRDMNGFLNRKTRQQHHHGR